MVGNSAKREDQREDEDRNCRHNLVLAKTPVNMVAVKGCSATPIGKTKETETATGPGWQVYIEVTPGSGIEK